MSEPEIRIICEGSKRSPHEEAPRHLGAWKKSVTHSHTGWWVTSDEPSDVTYEGGDTYRPHRTVEEQTVDRGSTFEAERGYRHELRTKIRCTHPGCRVTFESSSDKFFAALDQIAASGLDVPVPLIMLEKATRLVDG